MFSKYHTDKPRKTRNSKNALFQPSEDTSQPRGGLSREISQIFHSHLGFPEFAFKPRPKRLKLRQAYPWNSKRQKPNTEEERESFRRSVTGIGPESDLSDLDDSEEEEEEDDARRKGVKTAASTPTSIEFSASPAPANDALPRNFTVERNVASEMDGRVDSVTSKGLVGMIPHKYRPYLKDPTGGYAEDWDSEPILHVEYPGEGALEKYSILTPMTWSAHEPTEELINYIKLVVDYYLTPEQAWQHFYYSQTDAEKFKHAENLVRVLENAQEARDGPAFCAAVDRFNTVIAQLKSDGTMRTNIQNMKGLPEELWTRISFQVYERAVGPRVDELRKYKAFSDEVYGELLPPLIYDIVHRTDLKPGKTFVDLGCGVANCLVQASLASGCDSWGIEMQAAPAELAQLQIAEMKKRVRMFGLNMGNVTCKKGNFLTDPDIMDVLRKTDVILVNNYAFSSKTNHSLLALFLELPDHALIVSMRPFGGRRITLEDNRRNHRHIGRDGIPQILTLVGKYSFGSDAVSWMPSGGNYFISKIDRKKADFVPPPRVSDSEADSE